jgi:hypothetical protein
VRYVTCLKATNLYKILIGSPKERDHFGDLGVDGMITFKRMLEKQGVKVWTNWRVP